MSTEAEMIEWKDRNIDVGGALVLAATFKDYAIFRTREGWILQWRGLTIGTGFPTLDAAKARAEEIESAIGWLTASSNGSYKIIAEHTDEINADIDVTHHVRTLLEVLGVEVTK